MSGWYFYSHDEDKWFTVYAASQGHDLIRPVGARFRTEPQVASYVAQRNAEQNYMTEPTAVDNQE